MKSLFIPAAAIAEPGSADRMYYCGARWYDSYLNRWTSPDSIIPDQYNPLDLDRYQYVRSNPLKYQDPSGHMAEEGDDGGCNSACMDRSRQSYLFSLVFKGSGENGAWTAKDWNYYYSHRDKLWGDPSQWINPDSEKGWDLFALHVERLASHYNGNQKGQFVEDFSLFFGGVSRDSSWLVAAMGASGGPSLPSMNYSNDGLDSRFIDSDDRRSNQSHHYAGIFFLSYHVDPELAIATNYVRDFDNPGDIDLGNQAAIDAYFFRFYSAGLSGLAPMIRSLKSP